MTELQNDPTASRLDRITGALLGLDVALAVSLPGIERTKAEDLVAKAHVVCPYSHATRGNIDVRPSVG